MDCWEAALSASLMSNAKPAINEPPTDTGAREIPLTLRELHVLHGIAQARRNSEIAQELFISTRTVEKHVENILRKLGVKRRRLAAEHLRVTTENSGKMTKTSAA
jgi:DNA-binding NarL/FixJ family response regulator